MGFFSVCFAIGKRLWKNHKTRKEAIKDAKAENTRDAKLLIWAVNIAEAFMWNFIVLISSLIVFLITQNHHSKFLGFLVDLCDWIMDGFFFLGGIIIFGGFFLAMTIGLFFGFDISPKNNIE